ncbi:Helix-turn-helix, AraC type [Pseudomonas syringae pv. philadelphi]|uniref:Helix-turn-helix, AraC type n=2 Tax=Pseudomonas syringae group genomosp. 3 TaxID=251701 RepID=A0A3M3YRC7_9PSED|nr:Helix-turn-helix, AraC type [Pseudomonas syringae pv. philadelphi]
MNVTHRALSGNFHFANTPPQAPDDEASMAVIFPVDSPPARERFDQWQDVVSSTYGLVASQPLGNRPFNGQLSVKEHGDVTFTRIQSSPIRYRRSRRDRQSDHFLISLSFCPDAFVVQNDRESRQSTGDIVLYDSARPYACGHPEGDDQIVLTVPRELLLQHMPNADTLVCRTLQSQSPLGNIARTLLTEACNSPSLPQSLGERLSASLLDVLSTAYDSAFADTDARRQSHQAQLLQRTKQYLLKHLPDPELTVESIAQANHVSPRTLNRLFASQGTTAIRWLWQQRLSACHNALLKGHVRQVSEAALSFGFTNLSHFSRAFKNVYGVSPRQLLASR